ncbi:universal stress protein, partial [Chloroflexota bacterium]
YLDKSRGRAIEVGAATRVDYPAEGIVSYANKGGAKLIIMATHGRSGIGRWKLGSVADKVVRITTRQPVMLIRAGRTDCRCSRGGHTEEGLGPSGWLRKK